jgi:hypothetical protein
MIDPLATWLVNPWLLVAGASAVLLPVLIHLLNRRKFRVVDWAAMEFLLEADKKNRRRIRLENLLLLILRCLAVLLIGLLLARPFLPTNVTAGLIDAGQFERIVLLDDSLSMQAQAGNESAWEVAKKRLLDLTNGLAQERLDNRLTLVLASQPEGRVFNASPLGRARIDEISATIERLTASDGAANLARMLDELDQSLLSEPGNINRIVYVFTDLRRYDWEGDGARVDDAKAATERPIERLIRITKRAQACFLIDAGADDDRNLTIADVRSDEMLAVGVPTAFDVTVTNPSETAASNVRVKLIVGDALPLTTTIDRLAAGETASVRFHFTFAADEADAAAGNPAPWQVKVELQTEDQGGSDRLPNDSVAFYPARVVRGIPALIVDGDPSSDFGRAESFYLRRALMPAGPIPSGVMAEVITEDEVESISLDKYQVIFLLNNYRLGEKTIENIERLEKWVARGGGLVLLPGDQIDESAFNSQYWRDGLGLAPLKLIAIRGDELENTWARLRVENPNHEVLKQFAGQSNPLLENVKVFRWWDSAANASQLSENVDVVARLNDVDDSPAVAEKTLGKGRVVQFSMPADADWHNWTSDPSYLLIMQDLVRYLAAGRQSRGMLRVGEAIRQAVDLTQHELDVKLAGPRELKAELQAAAPVFQAPDSGESSSAEPTLWEVEHQAAAQGFYELTLTRRDGGSDPLLFAANVDPAEGDLKRVDRRTLERSLAGSNVKVVLAGQSLALADSGQQTEVWQYLLWLVVAVLAGEQVLGWFFGRARS